MTYPQHLHSPTCSEDIPSSQGVECKSLQFPQEQRHCSQTSYRYYLPYYRSIAALLYSRLHDLSVKYATSISRNKQHHPICHIQKLLAKPGSWQRHSWEAMKMHLPSCSSTGRASQETENKEAFKISQNKGNFRPNTEKKGFLLCVFSAPGINLSHFQSRWGASQSTRS